MSIGFTSVLTDDIVKFPKYQILNELESRVNVFHLTTCSLFRCHCACCAAVCSRVYQNDSLISFNMACAKINSADDAQRAYISDSPLDKATVSCPRHSLVKRNWSTLHSALPRHWITSPVSVWITHDVFQGLVQVIWFQCRYRQVEMQFSCSFQIPQHFLGTCQICKCWWRKFVWQAFCREHQIWSHSSSVLQFSDNCSE